MLEPDEFVPILEQTGQIREVGAWVLREACAQMALWHVGGDVLDVSVNVSGRQLDDDRIIEHIRSALLLSGLDAGSLIIEVTETSLMRDTTAAARRLHAIRDLGVSIAVDDFGTGYSSLAYLQQFPVDCIKIDRSFVRAMSDSPESLALIRTFVQLGRDLGLTTLAEGSEPTAPRTAGGSREPRISAPNATVRSRSGMSALDSVHLGSGFVGEASYHRHRVRRVQPSPPSRTPCETWPQRAHQAAGTRASDG